VSSLDFITNDERIGKKRNRSKLYPVSMASAHLLLSAFSTSLFEPLRRHVGGGGDQAVLIALRGFK
jgi:hypothetical protein